MISTGSYWTSSSPIISINGNPGFCSEAEIQLPLPHLGFFSETRMKIQLKSIIIGFALACVLLVGGVVALFYLSGPRYHQVLRAQRLASGATVNITSFNLVWGAEHDERDTTKDCFALAYVSAFPDRDAVGREQELHDVFELIRPVSEQWRFDKATVAAFPTTERKGKYDLYLFTRKQDGTWNADRQVMKVFVND
jgi:hypothetical protein